VNRAAAAAVARQLDLDLDDLAICLACLSFVACAIDVGDPDEVDSWTREIAPDLWNEGLREPVRMALHRARERGLAKSGEAIRSVENEGAQSLVVHAIVQKLGADLSARAQGDLLKMGFEPWPPPARGGGRLDG
jgi:hypothetical protein